jgi:prevent-host-death family protein
LEIINIHEAKTHLSRYLQQVADGGEVIIGKYNEPIAKLIPYTRDRQKYHFGLLSGKIKIADDFDVTEGPQPDLSDLSEIFEPKLPEMPEMSDVLEME